MCSPGPGAAVYGKARGRMPQIPTSNVCTTELNNKYMHASPLPLDCKVRAGAEPLIFILSITSPVLALQRVDTQQIFVE
jgi:hypothetical protein